MDMISMIRISRKKISNSCIDVIFLSSIMSCIHKIISLGMRESLTFRNTLTRPPKGQARTKLSGKRIISSLNSEAKICNRC